MSVSVSLKATESAEIAIVGKFPANQSAVQSAKMKIAHVNDCLDMGGSEKLTTILCRLQRALGHSTSVHCLYSIGVLGRELQTEGMDVVLHGPSSPIRLMRSLYRSFKSCTPDVVHCHNSTATVLGALPARLAGVKTIVATRHSLVQPPYQLRSETEVRGGFALLRLDCGSMRKHAEEFGSCSFSSPGENCSYLQWCIGGKSGCGSSSEVRLYPIACRALGARKRPGHATPRRCNRAPAHSRCASVDNW
jgi:hypothetical protein